MLTEFGGVRSVAPQLIYLLHLIPLLLPCRLYVISILLYIAGYLRVTPVVFVVCPGQQGVGVSINKWSYIGTFAYILPVIM